MSDANFRVDGSAPVLYPSRSEPLSGFLPESALPSQGKPATDTPTTKPSTQSTRRDIVAGYNEDTY